MNQKAVTSRHISKDIQRKYKQFLERQVLVLLSMPEDILLFLINRFTKMAVWKTTFVSEYLYTWISPN